MNTGKDLGLSSQFLSSIALAEEYEKLYGICPHRETGSPLQSVAMMPAELVEPNSQLYMYINRFVDLGVSDAIPNLTLDEFLGYPRDIVEELLRICREKAELKQKLAEHKATKEKLKGLHR